MYIDRYIARSDQLEAENGDRSRGTIYSSRFEGIDLLKPHGDSIAPMTITSVVRPPWCMTCRATYAIRAAAGVGVHSHVGQRSVVFVPINVHSTARAPVIVDSEMPK